MRRPVPTALTEITPINKTALRLCLTFILTALLAVHTSQTRAEALQPSTDYSPDQVIKIVVNALQANESGTDEGIATVWRFASPGNRASTGPLPRFTQMIKRGFSDMLNHLDSRYGDLSIKDNKAVQAVWLTTRSGSEVGYAFQLGRQTSGDYAGMWMTEAVIPIGRSRSDGIRI